MILRTARGRATASTRASPAGRARRRRPTGRGSSVATRVGDGHRVVAGERALARERFVERRGERELIRAGAELARRERLGGAVRRRPEHRAGSRQLRVGQPRDPEVGDFRAVARQHDVLGLDVAVDDARFVRRGERVAEVARHLYDVFDRDRPVGDPVAERRPFDVLEDEVEPDRLLLPHVEERHEVRVGDRRRGARLVLHPREELLARLRGDAEIVAQDLDRDVTPEDGVAGEQDAPHAAEPELAHDRVAAYLSGQIHPWPSDSPSPAAGRKPHSRATSPSARVRGRCRASLSLRPSSSGG